MRHVFAFLLLLFGLFAHADTILSKAYVKNDRLYLLFANAVDPEAFHTFKLTNNGLVRYVFDLKDTRMGSKRVPLGLSHSGVEAIRISQYKAHTVRIVIETKHSYRMLHGRKGVYLYNITLPKTKKNVRDLFSNVGNKEKPKNTYKKTTPVHHTPTYSKKHKAPPKTKTITPRHRYTVVVDPGHGGHDTGAIGAHKREKDIVLQIAKKLRRHLSRMGFRVLMTRSSDHFVKLKNRTRLANKKHGDVFVSIHANSIASRKKRYRHGVETFFLQTTRSARAKRVAARENSVVLRRSDKLSKNVILNSVMTGPKIVLSNKLAIDIQSHILGNLRTKYKGVADGGVRPAPFWVLVGAEMPAVLVETGYISNPTERRHLLDPHYQDLLAKGIAEGIANYLKNREREFE